MLGLVDPLSSFRGFPGDSNCKDSTYSPGDLGSVPGLGRSPGERMTSHSSILVWRILWTEECGGLPPTGLQRVGHDWATITYTLAVLGS